MTDHKMKHLHSILIIVDDHADDLNFVRHSKLLHRLATRGRHEAISFILSTQRYRSLANIIRLNASSLYIFKLKNQTELDAFIEESSALVDKKTLLEIYKEAVKEPYSFLYINIHSKDINNMFYIRFEKVFKIDTRMVPLICIVILVLSREWEIDPYILGYFRYFRQLFA